MTLGQLIREERQRRLPKMSQAALARKAGVSPGAVWRIENGQRGGLQDTITKLINALGLDADYVQRRLAGELPPLPKPAAEMSTEELLEQLRIIVKRGAPVTIMLVDQRAAAGYIGGNISEGEAAVEPIIYLPAPDERNHDLLGIRVSGSCLEPLIMDGHIAIVDRSVEAQPGKIVLAIHEGEALLKRLEIRDGRPYLIALNSEVVIPVNENTRIAGVVKVGMYTVP